MIVILAAAAAATEPQVRSYAVTGPAFACGNAFAVRLGQGERLRWTDRMMDFVDYRLETPRGATVIYEGNAPQPGGIVRRTGRSWPDVVVVHGAVAVAKRLRFDADALRRCARPGTAARR